MRKSIYTLVLFAVLAGTTQGQRLVNVPPNVIDGLATTIQADSVARTAALPTQTIYILARNGYYPCVQAINNYNYFLYIKAASGTGYRPLLVPSPTSGTTYAYNINFRSNGKLEGLTLEASRPTGGVNNRYINLYNGSSLWVKDCEVMHDRGGAIAIWSDSCSLYMEDCFVHSIGHPKSLGGNGRVVDIRPTNFQDSIVVQNTTFFNLTDRIFRNVGTSVNYVKWDHNTGLTTEGFHGGFEAGKTRELIVTNNIFYNTIALGSFKKRTSTGSATHEQTQPEKWKMWVLTLDTLYADSKITVRNNNIFWDQAYKDLWVKYKDSTEAPGNITPTIMKALVDSTKAYFSETLTFQAPPPSIYNFIDSALAFPNSVSLPENWSFAYQDSLGKSPVNASYGTTAASYTRADGGFPVGDLNWYPALKARWLNNLPADVAPGEGGIPAHYALEQNYPNPFNPSTNLSFDMSAAGFVSLVVYDVLGREVATLVNEARQAGTHSVSWNAAGQSSGVYFCKMQAGSFVATKQMLLVK